MDRRAVIGGMGALTLPAAASKIADLRLPGGPSLRPLRDFADKRGMIVQRVRPPLLETPLEVFDQGVITPNDRFFVRWSGGLMPTAITAAEHRLVVRGAVRTPLSLTLGQVAAAGEHREIVAVNQCAGNGRGLQEPRVTGAQWGNGAMGNARWTGVRLRDVLAQAGLAPGAVGVRFAGLDVPPIEGQPQYKKSLSVDHALSDEVLVAWGMNGAPLPILNGYPLRLIVPGWYGTFWVKMLADIEVLTVEDESYFMAKSYRLPTVPVAPGDKGFPTKPVTIMPPRALITSPEHGTAVALDQPFDVRGLALGGDRGVAKVELIVDGRVQIATLEAEQGRYGFRRWRAVARSTESQPVIAALCTNTNGITQPMEQAWNPSGYARDAADPVTLVTVA